MNSGKRRGLDLDSIDAVQLVGMCGSSMGYRDDR